MLKRVDRFKNEFFYFLEGEKRFNFRNSKEKLLLLYYRISFFYIRKQKHNRTIRRFNFLESRHDDGRTLFIERRNGGEKKGSGRVGRCRYEFRFVYEYASDVNSTRGRSGPLQLQLHTRAAMQAACDRESTLRLPSAGRLA